MKQRSYYWEQAPPNWHDVESKPAKIEQVDDHTQRQEVRVRRGAKDGFESYAVTVSHIRKRHKGNKARDSARNDD